MTGEWLSGKISLDSTEYRAAISEINRELRVLDSGFKADNASLGDWTKSATGMENRIQSLNQQIELQKNKVANLRAEHDRLVATNGEGSRAAQDLQIKLNTETTALGKMQVEVKTDTASLKEMSTGEKEAGAAAATAGEGIGAMGAITAGVTAIVSAAVIVIGAMVAAVGALGAGIAVLVKTTMNWGQGLDNAIKLLGVTSPQAAGLALISDAVGLSLDDLTLCLDRMSKGLLTVDGKLGVAGKTLKDMGIDARDTNNDLKSSPALLEEIANKLIVMKDGQEKVAIEMELFGRSGTKIDEILRQVANGGMQRYIDQAVSMGLALSPDQIDKIHNLGMNINILKDQFTGIAMVLGITFIPMLQSAITWIGKTVESLMPAIQQFGDFLSLLFQIPKAAPGGSPAASNWEKTGDITGMTQDEINYMWVQYWKDKKNPKPSGGTYTGGQGTAPAASSGAGTLGGPGGERIGVAITLTPLEQTIMDIKDWLVNTAEPWIKNLDWTGAITAIEGIFKPGGTLDQIAHPDKYPSSFAAQAFSPTGHLDQWISDEVKSWVETGKAQLDIENFGQSISDWWQNNIRGPLNDLFSGKAVGAVTVESDFVWKYILTPLEKNITDFKAKMREIGDGIGGAIRSMVNGVIDWVNAAINAVNKALGVHIPPIQHMTAPAAPQGPGISGAGQLTVPGLASGGVLGNANWVGEAGKELVIGGYVFPHDISMRLADLFGNIHGLQSGGSLMPNFGGSIVEAMLNALAQAQQQLARSMGGGFTPMVPVAAGGSSQDFSFYGTTIIQGNQQPGGLGDHLLNDRRY